MCVYRAVRKARGGNAVPPTPPAHSSGPLLTSLPPLCRPPLFCMYMYIYSSLATRSPACPSVNDGVWPDGGECGVVSGLEVAAVVVTTSRSPRELFSKNRVATLYASPPPPPPQPPPPPRPIRTISIYVRARTDGFSFAAPVLCPVTACQIQYISTRRTRR